MADIYRRVNGMKIERFLGKIGPVQRELEARAFEIGIRAETRLLEHRLEGHAQIKVDTMDNIDWYVWLDDTNGDQAALSIEFGRAGWVDVETGRVFGAMEGLFILTDAANLKRAKGRRLPKIKWRGKRKGSEAG